MKSLPALTPEERFGIRQMLDVGCIITRKRPLLSARFGRLYKAGFVSAEAQGSQIRIWITPYGRRWLPLILAERPSPPVATGAKWPAHRTQELFALVASGLSISAAARRLGVSRSAGIAHYRRQRARVAA